MLYSEEGHPVLLGIVALFLSLLPFVLWVFAVLALGGMWRRMVRARRVFFMRALIVLLFGLTLCAGLAVPTRRYVVEANLHIDPAPGQTTLPALPVTEVRAWGLTNWIERRETWIGTIGVLGTGQVEWTVDRYGILAFLPTLIVLFLLARALWRILPRMYRLPEHLCDFCGYDTRGSASAVCPECGETVS